MLDPNLEQYATPKQWEYLKANDEYGSHGKAAKIFGVHKSNISRAVAAVKKKAAMRGYAPDHDLTHPVPDGFKLRGTSTLYDAQTGDAKIQWVKSEADKERQLEIFREAVSAMSSGITRVRPTDGPKASAKHLCACYPVGDHHMGMLSWHPETGADYDLEISERLLDAATDHLVGSSISCDQALVVFLGDMMHYDSWVSVTPTSGFQLDADGRFPKMVRAAIRSMRYLIETVSAHHKAVHVIIEIGNHDLASSIFLMECLSSLYENEPRITIDTSPAHYHYFRFGKTFVGTHHGHGVKNLANLPLIMATDRPEDWAMSEYRYWWTGHIHKDTAKDVQGVKVESFRVLGPNDAWSSQKGYRAARDMKRIILDKDFGEMERIIFNPKMLDGR